MKTLIETRLTPQITETEIREVILNCLPPDFSDHKRLQRDVASVQPRAICDQILRGKEVKNIEKIKKSFPR